MHIITGRARGKKLKELPGLETRPTTGRIKESLFNIIQFEIEGRQILDLFAGTGQLGLETLSRGAAHCTFVDARRDAVALIRENLAATRLADDATVVQGDAMDFLARRKARYDLIFLDPPYGSPLLEQALDYIAGIDILRPHGIIVCESAVEEELPSLSAPYEMGRQYRYGHIKLTTYRRQGE